MFKNFLTVLIAVSFVLTGTPVFAALNINEVGFGLGSEHRNEGAYGSGSYSEGRAERAIDANRGNRLESRWPDKT